MSQMRVVGEFKDNDGYPGKVFRYSSEDEKLFKDFVIVVPHEITGTLDDYEVGLFVYEHAALLDESARCVMAAAERLIPGIGGLIVGLPGTPAWVIRRDLDAL